jgi:hypothetical protein
MQIIRPDFHIMCIIPHKFSIDLISYSILSYINLISYHTSSISITFSNTSWSEIIYISYLQWQYFMTGIQKLMNSISLIPHKKQFKSRISSFFFDVKTLLQVSWLTQLTFNLITKILIWTKISSQLERASQN